jgi:hypothetical protein
MGRQTACPAHLESALRSPPSPACTTCTAPARVVQPPLSWPLVWGLLSSPPVLLQFVLRAALCVPIHVLFALLACFALPRRLYRQPGSAFVTRSIGRSRSGLRPVPFDFTRCGRRTQPCSRSAFESLQIAGTEGGNFYLRRSTIIRLVRLLRRVFLPNVGKAHGVCG